MLLNQRYQYYTFLIFNIVIWFSKLLIFTLSSASSNTSFWSSTPIILEVVNVLNISGIGAFPVQKSIIFILSVTLQNLASKTESKLKLKYSSF